MLHTIALFAPPFLSSDPLFYAAIGRSMAEYHGSAYAPLRDTLPAGDPFLRQLGPDWQRGTSAYFPGWNQVARAVAWWAGDSVTTALRLHQMVGLLAILVAAALVGAATRARDRDGAGSAAAAVLFCPLAVIEGTVSGHNDALLAVSTALVVVASQKRRALGSLVAVAAGLFIKASAMLACIVTAVASIVRPLRVTPRRLLLATSIIAVAATALAPVVAAELGRFTDLVNPATLQCERALECIPRWLLWSNGFAHGAFAVGILFRLAGAAWLVYAGWRAGTEDRLLAWLSSGLLGFYLYFHAYVQPWYLLPLLPLLPFSTSRTRRALAVACIAWLCPYSVLICLNCRASSIEIWLERTVGLAVVVLPATYFLWFEPTCTSSRNPSPKYR
jgi:hypothetical protein